ncbi:MAG: hypothetical protein Q8L52_02625 [bacterium]|nr:hypothetical protein [bacterium]
MKNIISLVLCVVAIALPLRGAAQALPDLVANATIASPSSSAVGQTVSFSGKISNAIGAGTASKTSGFPNTFQVMRLDPTLPDQITIEGIDGSQVVNVATTSLALIAANPLIYSLAANASLSVSGLYNFTSPGTYAFNLCANVNTSWNLNDSVSESSGNNNCDAWRLIHVCAAGSSWSTESNACLANVAIADFTSSPPTVPYDSGTQLNLIGVTGGGTIICSIKNDADSNVISVPIDAGGSGSGPSGNLKVATIFTLTCANNVGPDVTKSTTVSIAVGEGNQPPAVPTISGSVSSPPNTSYSFSSKDPEGNNIRYQIDWNNDKVVDEELPSATTYVPSGTSVNAAKDWKSIGSKTFKVRAVDEGGVASAWSEYAVTLACAAHTTWSPEDLACIPDVNIGVFAAASSIDNGKSTPLTGGRITGGGTITCSISNDADSSVISAPLLTNGIVSKNSRALTKKTTFTLVCGNGVGPPAFKTATVKVSPVPGSGVCFQYHYSCTAGTSGSNVEGTSSWTWTCTGTNGTDSCREAKTAVSAEPQIGGAIIGVLGVAAFSLAMQSAVSSIKGLPFGGLDIFMFPVTCEIPPFVPLPCQFTPPIPPPAFYYDFFIMMHGLTVPPVGFLAVPIWEPLAFPNYALFPGEWALGTIAPIAPVGGWFFPSIPIPPFGCTPSMCIPIAVTYGTVTPFTGSSIF